MIVLLRPGIDWVRQVGFPFSIRALIRGLAVRVLEQFLQSVLDERRVNKVITIGDVLGFVEMLRALLNDLPDLYVEPGEPASTT